MIEYGNGLLFIGKDSLEIDTGLSEREATHGKVFQNINENGIIIKLKDDGTFDFENEEIKRFCLEYRIKKKEKRNTKSTDNYFWFDTIKIKGAQNNDFAHNLLRHIRNAMAHGNFKKGRSKKAFYTLEDYNKNKEKTMYGKINADLFWKYLNMILHTSPFISNTINFK